MSQRNKFPIRTCPINPKSLVGIGSKKTLIRDRLPRGSLQGEASCISSASLMNSASISMDNSGSSPLPYQLEKALGVWFIFVWFGGLAVAARAACVLP